MIEMEKREFEGEPRSPNLVPRGLALLFVGALLGAVCTSLVMVSVWRADNQSRDEQFAQATVGLFVCARQRAQYKKKAKAACCCTCDGPED